MIDPVKSILRLSYYYSRFIGVINFEIDMRTGQARITRLASIYAMLVNGLVLGATLCLTHYLIAVLWSNARLLHEYLFVAIRCIEIICVMITLLNHWRQRSRLINLINAFRLLASQKPQVTRMWRRRVITKFISVLLSELSLFAFITLGKYYVVKLSFVTLMMYTLTILTNVIGSHYYFAMVNALSHFKLLNQEIQTVLVNIHCLESENRRAAFMTKCCSLADQLEDIALTQSEVQMLIKRATRIFEIQGLCATIVCYFSSIADIYFIFLNIYRKEGVGCNFANNILFFFVMGFYFVDIVITINNLNTLLEAHADMVRLMEQFSTIAPGLDKRLEEVIETFQLQLRRNPLKIRYLHFYKMDRSEIIAFVSSVVKNSLVLIQYELENK